MLGFTRCASTACFTQACQFIAGVPLCREHRDELEKHFCAAPKEASPPIGQMSKAVVTRAKRNQGPRITSRVKLSPYQSSVEPGLGESLGCVYYVTTRQASDYIKIGTTRRASERFRALSATGRIRLLVAEPGGRYEESERHRQFASVRQQGTELFRYTEAVGEHIDELRERFPNYRDLTDVGHEYD
jgi:hypothetical protein